MSLKRFFSLSLIGVGAFTAAVVRAEPADKAEVDALRAEVQRLQQQVDALTRLLQANHEAAPASVPVSAPTSPSAVAAVPHDGNGSPTAPSGKAVVDDRGFVLSSADGSDSLKLRGMVQLDGRFYFGDGSDTNDTFILRRARILAEGTFAKNYSFLIVPDFAGSAATILDANVGVRLSDALAVRVGKFKSPIGMEEMQTDSGTFFNERALVNNLVPSRDLGLLASGDLARGTVSYSAGVVAGVPDGGTTNADTDNDKDVVGRVLFTPFKGDLDSALHGLSFGIGGTAGRHKGAAGRTVGYKTDGQQTFFAYNSGVIADGETWRVSPQFDYRRGPFGLMGEYAISAATLRPSATGARSQLRHDAWQFVGGYVVTGEDSSYAGVSPRTNFDWSAGTWGALELVGRYSQLNIDDAAFPVFAAPTTSADAAKAFGVGANWYLTKVIALKFDYYQTRFAFNATAPSVSATPLLQQDEKALITRFQLSF